MRALNPAAGRTGFNRKVPVIRILPELIVALC
jgi:hypothetical protein